MKDKLKLKAWLIVNSFLQTKKFNELNGMLLAAANKFHIALEVYGNSEFLVRYDVHGVHIVEVCTVKPENAVCSWRSSEQVIMRDLPDFILFWDKDIRLARAFESLGIPVYNCADAIEACDDKSLTHRILSGHGIAMPKTIPAPMTYEAAGYSNLDFLDVVEEQLSYPFIVKECFGSFGAQVYLAHTREEAEKLLCSLAGKPLIFQEYIASGTGRDIRIEMVGGEAAAAMYRWHENDFRANVTNGGQMRPYHPTDAQIEMAGEVCRILKLDFAGVDLLFGKDDKPVLCEVNSNAHIKNLYDCTGINVADRIMEYILSKPPCPHRERHHV